MTVADPLIQSQRCVVRLHRFTVDEYDRLRRSGVLAEKDPIEMMEGYIYIKMDFGPPYGVPLGLPPVEWLDGFDTPPETPLRRFTVEEYEGLLAAGVLPPELRTELVEGWIVEKVTHNPAHDSTMQRVGKLLIQNLPGDWEPRIQLSTVMDDGEPEPDFAVVRGPVGRYDRHHPRPHDIELLIEVSDSTLSTDIGSKLRMYARNYVRVYWVVNLISRRVEVFTQPSGPTAVPEYGSHVQYHPGQTVPLVIRDQTVADLPVDLMLPEKSAIVE